jgi:hypothetical protein
MTARRPSKISGAIPIHGPREEEHFRRLLHAFNEDRLEVDADENLREAVDSQTLRVARNLPGEIEIQPLHPALTNYGPVSAANFFRQARANQQPAARRPPAPLRAGLWPRSQKASRSYNGYLSNSCSASAWQHTRLADSPDLLQSFNAEPQNPVALMEVGKSCRHTKEDLIGNGENQLPSRRKGPKRVRRTGARERRDDEENLPQQPQHILHGAVLLRNMRLSRAERRNRGDSSEESLTAREARDRREPAPKLETRSGVFQSTRPLSSDPAHCLMQDWLRETRGDASPRNDGDGPSFVQLRRSTDEEVHSAIDPLRCSPVPQAQRTRTSVGPRHSQPSSPPSDTKARNERIWQDSVGHALLDPGDHEFDTSDDDSTSSRGDSALDHALMDLDPNIPQVSARSHSSSIGDDRTKDTKLAFLEYLKVPTLSPKQEEQAHFLPSKLIMEGDELSAIHQNGFKHEQIAPMNAVEDNLGGGQMELTPLTPGPNFGAMEVDTPEASTLTELDRTERLRATKDSLALGNRAADSTIGKSA